MIKILRVEVPEGCIIDSVSSEKPRFTELEFIEFTPPTEEEISNILARFYRDKEYSTLEATFDILSKLGGGER